MSVAGHLEGGNQSAFTWTGPYGCGKSSLALVLATMLGGEASLRKLARSVLGADLVEKLAKPLRVPSARNARVWKVVRVAGNRQDPASQLAQGLLSAEIPRVGKRLGERPDASRVLKVLSDVASISEYGGLLLVVDELGKMLEHIAARDGDIHFFQELAETASRSKGRMIVVGILHQAFEQYATRLGREARDEWTKIQGRFVDIPISATVDEVIELTSRAISTQLKHPETRSLAQLIGRAILRNRPTLSKDLSARLDRCWPLHPVTAALLGPVSKRRFSQNERSTFAFLGSHEPKGFREFLKTNEIESASSYEPARYWDYLRTNLEPSILASPDGHRWAQAAESVSRTEARGDEVHARVMKTIGLIDLFRNGSGLIASEEILSSCISNISGARLRSALQDLVSWSVAVYRKHSEAYAVFEGSDFDIDAATNEQLGSTNVLDVSRLSKLAALQPILPKRHYLTTGALRWFESALATTVPSIDLNAKPQSGQAGRFVLLINDGSMSPSSHRRLSQEASRGHGNFPVVIGLAPNSEKVVSLGRELLAVESLPTTRPELTGDAVARKELMARIASVSAKLEEELTIARDTAEWFVEGKRCVVNGSQDLYRLASDLCDEVFASAPVILSELVNRSSVSSNAQAAINALVAAMVSRPTEFAFGIEGYPAERGLYETVFFATGLHEEQALNSFAFVRPRGGHKSARFLPLWEAADELLSKSKQPVSLVALLDKWQRPPFGLAAGVVGPIALAYILSNRAQTAAYQEGVYQPDLGELFAHEVIRDPAVLSLRRLVSSGERSEFLSKIASVISTVLTTHCDAEPLAIGRALVKFVFDLPPWTRRTAQLSDGAMRLRTILLAASDPLKLVLVDLPNIAQESRSNDAGEGLFNQLSEMSAAYPAMLARVRGRFIRALAARDSSASVLRSRASIVKGITGDLRVEALATRLANYSEAFESIEGLLSLAANKPPKEWSDLDVDMATLSLADLALKFRNAEVLAAVRDRAPSRLAVGFVVGTGEAGQATMRAIDVGIDEMRPVEALTRQVLDLCAASGEAPRLALAALARAGANLIEQIPIKDEAN